MSLAYPHERLQLPEALRRQLLDFRRRVWLIKMAEAACAAAFAVVAAYLLMFLLDRVFDTPPWSGSPPRSMTLACRASVWLIRGWSGT